MVQNQRDDLTRRTVTRAHGTGRDDIDHLHRLAAEWGFLADLCFADLLLYVEAGDGRWLVVDQVRPATNQTMYVDRLRRLVGRRRSSRASSSQAAAAGVKVEGEINADGDDPTIGADAGDPGPSRRPHRSPC